MSRIRKVFITIVVLLLLSLTAFRVYRGVIIPKGNEIIRIYCPGGFYKEIQSEDPPRHPRHISSRGRVFLFECDWIVTQ